MPARSMFRSLNAAARHCVLRMEVIADEFNSQVEMFRARAAGENVD